MLYKHCVKYLSIPCLSNIIAALCQIQHSSDRGGQLHKILYNLKATVLNSKSMVSPRWLTVSPPPEGL